jgi:hypothetical protein
MKDSKKIHSLRCRVCGRPVSSEDVAFGVVDKPLFYAHTGECAETINAATDTLGKFTKILLESKRPGLAKQISQGIDKFQRFMRILGE